VIFDVLWSDGADLTTQPYKERRKTLSSLKLDGAAWTTPETFDDRCALFTAVCELGFEGVVAKSQSSLYRRNNRGWVNPNYWRRDVEREAMTRKQQQRHRRGASTRARSRL
jgi:ATP-dependent DNA ligase